MTPCNHSAAISEFADEIRDVALNLNEAYQTAVIVGDTERTAQYYHELNGIARVMELLNEKLSKHCD